MSSLNYAHEKLSVAVATMATSTDTLQERLVDAFMEFHTLQTGDFPKALQSAYSDVHTSLTNIPAKGNEGSVVATTSVMSDKEAETLIGQIVDLYDEVAQLVGRKS